MSRLMVLGDVHGAAKALDQVFERSAFDFENDRLIFLGDVADGWPETRRCIDILLSVKNLTHILGNHDAWLRNWVRCGAKPSIWTSQGGQATLESYGSRDDFPAAHAEYLDNAKSWHDDDGRIFVHAGFWGHPASTDEETLCWDRELWQDAVMLQRNWNPGNGPPKVSNFREVYVGHTATTRMTLEPMQACEMWNLDQGCGWAGKLSLMDVDTKEFWQSDLVKELYPNVKGR